jgi:hypothetical protein
VHGVQSLDTITGMNIDPSESVTMT